MLSRLRGLFSRARRNFRGIWHKTKPLSGSFDDFLTLLRRGNNFNAAVFVRYDQPLYLDIFDAPRRSLLLLVLLCRG